MEPIIEVKDISKTFNSSHRESTEALQQVTFSINEGETFGILGQSGSGKSTIARILTGLTAPSSGNVTVDGISYSKNAQMPKALIGKMQMVFQNPLESFDPRKTIGNGIGESLLNLGMPKKEIKSRVAAQVKKCGLPEEFADRYPHQLSGGQCQRAAIARALITNPKILICDEATSSLDVTVQKQIIELLADLKRESNLTIVFISHNIPLVELFCDRGIILKNGQLKSTFEATSSNLIEYFKKIE